MERGDTGRRVAAAYDVVAATYAERNSVMPPAYLELGPRFLALAGAGGGVLDLGCGAGRDLGWLLSQGADVLGGDLSAGMLAQARLQLQTRSVGRLIRLDMTALPCPDASFGGVWCSASLLHLPKQLAPRALAEMHRVLTPSGPLLLGIQEGDSEGWEAGAYEAHVERFFARYRQDEAESMLTEAGFAIQDLHTGEARNRRWLTFLSIRCP
jgi:ubiquinone/menaquinone biosynthesis C-methylase UbiE